MQGLHSAPHQTRFPSLSFVTGEAAWTLPVCSSANLRLLGQGRGGQKYMCCWLQRWWSPSDGCSQRGPCSSSSTSTVLRKSLKIPVCVRSDGLVPARLPCTYKVRSELLLRRERCHHHTVRVCDAALLVRFDPVWCTLASSVHQAASTRPVRERWRGHVECSLSTFIVFITNKTLSYQSVRQPHAPTTTHSLT